MDGHEMDMTERLFASGYHVVAGRGKVAVAVPPLPDDLQIPDDDLITDLFSRGRVEWLAMGDEDGELARFDHEDLRRDPSLPR